jgi:crotonobetaine/carnitine-CoA ligase
MNVLSCQVLATLWMGGTVVLQPRFSAGRFWDVALRNNCTWASIVPFCANALMNQDVPQHKFRVWGFGVNGVYDKKFGLRCLGWWGMTETVTVDIVGSVHHDDTPYTLGRPSPLYEIVVLSSDGTPSEKGESGELRIRGIPGISLFDHYLNNPKATEESFDSEGFFITGDNVRKNSEGTLSFEDRIKDMLKVGGENVSAAEVERVILSLPNVSEVAVVAKPDKMLTEVPVAFVLASHEPNTSELINKIEKICIESLSDFKRPRQIRVVDSLPRANLEKIAKAKLREQLLEED